MHHTCLAHRLLWPAVLGLVCPGLQAGAAEAPQGGPTIPGVLHTVRGAAAADRLGAAVAGTGDVDGDLVDDFAVGAPGDDTAGVDAGVVLVLSGATGAVLRTWTGAAAGDAFGSALAPAGDLDADGRADVLVGVPGDDAAGANAGAALVLSGETGAVLRSWAGSAAGDAFGSAVAGGFHVDLDGFPDAVAGAPGGGYAKVFSGRTGALLLDIAPAGSTPADAVGAAVAGLGDVSGDLFGDLAVGIPGDDSAGADAGAAIVVSGRDGTTLYRLQGAAAGDALGTSVAGAGDVDGDGIRDLVAGAPGEDGGGRVDAGSARVFAGRTGALLFAARGQAAGDALGTSVAGAGDVDGDGFADVLAGAPGHDAGGVDAGAVRAISGRQRVVLVTWRGSAAGDAFGQAVAGAGDVDDDDYDDLLAGAPGDDTGGADAGSAQVLARQPWDRVGNGQLLAPVAAGGLFGTGMAGVGDVNADGVPDYAIGAVRDANLEGAVRVFSGADHSVLHTFTGGAPSIFFGVTMAAAGDVNQDGYADILTGAQHWTTTTRFEGRATVRSGRDGSILHQWFGVLPQAHMGSALGTLGDVDGDTVDDVFVGLLKQNQDTGAVWVFSGATGQKLYEVDGGAPTDWFSMQGAAVDDLDGDGVVDFAIGAPQPLGVLPGYAVVLSGRDGTQLYRFSGIAAGDLFGWAVAGPGDVNGDGVGDIAIGAPNADPGGRGNAGMVRVFSGADGAKLYDYTGSVGGEMLGKALVGPGDVNGDGLADLLIGAPGARPGGVQEAGRCYLYASREGLLQVFDGGTAIGGLGSSVAAIGDVNGDGYADLAIGAPGENPNGTGSGAAYVFETAVRSDPGSATPFGAGCVTSTGHLPRLTTRSRPLVGGTFTIELGPLPPLSIPWGMLRLGESNRFEKGIPLPLQLEQAPGCTLYTNSSALIPFEVRAAGSPVAQSLPNNPALVGMELYYQCFVRDAAQNALGMTLSNALRIRVGR